MGIETAIVLQVGSGVMSGRAADKAGKETQKQLEQQAAVVRAEAKRDAGRLRLRHKQDVARKKLQFFHQGVGIAGSPANIIASDINLQDEEARAIIARGNAQSSLLIAQGQNARNAGRSALLSNIIGGIASGVMTGVMANSLQTKELDTLGTGISPQPPQSTSSSNQGQISDILTGSNRSIGKQASSGQISDILTGK